MQAIKVESNVSQPELINSKSSKVVGAKKSKKLGKGIEVEGESLKSLGLEKNNGAINFQDALKKSQTKLSGAKITSDNKVQKNSSKDDKKSDLENVSENLVLNTVTNDFRNFDEILKNTGDQDIADAMPKLKFSANQSKEQKQKMGGNVINVVNEGIESKIPLSGGANLKEVDDERSTNQNSFQAIKVNPTNIEAKVANTTLQDLDEKPLNMSPEEQKIWNELEQTSRLNVSPAFKKIAGKSEQMNMKLSDREIERITSPLDTQTNGSQKAVEQFNQPRIKSIESGIEKNESAVIQNLGNPEVAKTLQEHAPFNHKLERGDKDVKEMASFLSGDLPGGTWQMAKAEVNLAEEKIAYDALQKLKSGELNMDDLSSKGEVKKETKDVTEELQAVFDTLKGMNSPAKAGIAELKQESSGNNSTDMSNQIERHLDMLVFRPNQRVKVLLQPEDLGGIEMIAKEIGGKLQIEMTVQKNETLQNLQSETKELMDKVSEKTGVQIAGISLKSGEVSTSSNANQNDTVQNQQQNSFQRPNHEGGQKDRREENSSQNLNSYTSSIAKSNSEQHKAGNRIPSTPYGSRVNIRV